MINIKSTHEDGKFRMVVTPEFKDKFEPPVIESEAFIDIIKRRSKLGSSAEGGIEVTKYFMDQVSTDYGDGIILWMSPFEEWHTVIDDLLHDSKENITE